MSQNFTANGTGFIKNGIGTWNIGSIGNTYNGGFTLNDGTVIVSGVNSFGTEALTINGGVIESSRDIAFRSNSIVIGGDFAFAGSGDSSWTATVDIGSAVRTITNNSSGSRTFGGVISGSGGLTFAGNSGIVLSGANTYTGATTIRGGLTLADTGTIANSSSIVVGDAGSNGAVLDVTEKSGGFDIGTMQTLSGIGTIDATGTAVIIGGTHSVGNDGVGLQTITGNLEYNPSSIFEWELDDYVSSLTDPMGVRGDDYDALDSDSVSVSSGAIFRVILSGTDDLTEDFWTVQQQWTDIFSANTFTNANMTSLFDTFEIFDSSGSDITASFTSSTGRFTFNQSSLEFSAVPEPTSALAGLLIAVGLMRRSRR